MPNIIKRCAAIAAASAMSLSSVYSYAGSYEFEKFTVDWDSVFTVGVQYRIQDRKKHISEGSTGATGDLDNLGTIIDNAFIINSNDGNMNFDKGFTSQRVSILSEADFNFGDWGFFVRGKYWHNFVYGKNTDMTRQGWEEYNANPKFGSNGGHTSSFGEFNPAAKDYQESGKRLLDVFWYGEIPLWNDTNMTLRIGRQVISWGEALLSGGGLATNINPVDADIRNQPGLEIKELFLPTGAIFVQTSLTETIGFEGYYQYEWNPAFIDPSSGYFSEFDSIGAGGNTFIFLSGTEDRILGVEIQDALADGITPTTEAGVSYVGTGCDPLNPNESQANCEIADMQDQMLGRLLSFLPQSCGALDTDDSSCRLLAPYLLRKDKAASQGQFGLAFNFFLESGAEAGLYYVNYHEKIPTWVLPLDSLVTFAPIIDLLIEAVDPVRYQNTFGAAGERFDGVEDLGSTLSVLQLNALLAFLNVLPATDGTVLDITQDLIRNPDKLFSEFSIALPPAQALAAQTEVVKVATAVVAAGAADAFLGQYGFGADTEIRSLNYRLQYFEDVTMIGATYSTVLGDANVATEITYREDTPLLGADVARTAQLGKVINWHINTLMVFEPKRMFGLPLWDFSSLVVEAMLWDIPGKLEYDPNDINNPDRLAVQNTPNGVGVSFFWSLEHQNVFTGWDVMIPIYMNWGIDGSQFNAGYRDGQVTTATGITFKHLSGIELAWGITKFWGDSDDIFQMLTQDRDNMTVHFKYGF